MSKSFSALEAVVKIVAIDVFTDDLSEIWIEGKYKKLGTRYQISIDCNALDSQSNIYDLRVHFMSCASEVRDKIINDLTVGSIWILKGECVIFRDGFNEFNIGIYDPSYEPIDKILSKKSGITEKFIRECFKHTGA